jgi:exonuclease SbcD
MPEPIRLLHFADLHVGMENYGKLDPQTGISSRIRDFLDRLDEVVAFAFEHDADLVVFAGDAFKTRDPDPTQQREFARRIKKLADRIPVFMLVGNHDIPGIAARATSIDIFRALEVDNITVGRVIGSQVVQTRRGPVFLGWVPFPVRGRLLAQEEHRGASVEELDRAVGELITGELGDLARQAAVQDMPRVLVGHFSVGGATYGSERSVMLGRDLVIQKSALADPAWDYVCFAPSQLVTMADGVPRRIDQVKAGDSILNHLGEPDQVNSLSTRAYEGDLVEVSTYYLPGPVLRATPDHPILAIRREQLLCPIPSRQARGLVCTTNNARLSYPCNVCTIPDMPKAPQAEYVPAGQLHIGDFLCVPVPQDRSLAPSLAMADYVPNLRTETRDERIKIRVKGQGWAESVPAVITMDTDLARLCGYFLAEGSLMLSRRNTVAGIQFTFGSHETRYHQDVLDLAMRLFGKTCGLTKNKYGKSLGLSVSSRLIGEMFQTLFRSRGHGCRATFMPEFFLRLPTELQRQILVGAFRGDGHLGQRDRNRRRGLLTYATISEALAWQIWYLALRQGLTPALRRQVRDRRRVPNSIFTVDLYGTDVFGIGRETFGIALDTARKTKRLPVHDEKYVYVPIRAIRHVPYAGTVYNIEVERAHTYVAGGVAVHNCLGHIHKHQNLTPKSAVGVPPIVYSGSLERIDFGEEVEDKGFCWVRLERGNTHWEFHRVNSRPFRSINVDAREEEDPTAAVVAAIQARSVEGAVVRVQIALREGQETALRRRELEAALAPAAYVAAVSVEVERTTRLAGFGPNPESLTPLEWVERYFAARQKTPERMQQLLRAAEGLLNGEA